MVKGIYQQLFKGVAPMVDGDILIYSKDKPLLADYLQNLSVYVLRDFDTSPVSQHQLIVIDPSMELSELPRGILEVSCPIITPKIDLPSTHHVYDYIGGFCVIRKIRKCSAYLNFHIKFQEHNEMQVYLDNTKATDFSEMLYNFAFKFYDIRAKLVYPFETGGHSGCFILGESHFNWHSWPEEGRLDININSCRNVNPIPIMKRLLKELFRTDKIYSDYKEVEVHI